MALPIYTPLNNFLRTLGVSGYSFDPISWFTSAPSITSGSNGTVNDSGVWGNNPMTGGVVIDNGTGGQTDTTP